MSSRQNIVMLSMSRYEDWLQGVVNRNYFLYRELRASDAVDTIVLVDFLPHAFRRAVKVFWKDVHGPRHGTVLVQRPWIRVERIDAKTVHIATVLTPWFEKTFTAFLATFLQRQAIDAPILWSYLPTFVHAFALPWKLKVFDAVDDWTVHPAYRPWISRLRENYAAINEQADHVFLVTESLRSLFPGRETHTVPNGVDSGLFAHMTNERATPPVISYVGTIQERFDVPLLAAIARARPRYTFEIVGPVWHDVDVAPLRRLPNVRFFGRRQYKELPSLLAHASAGIVPHRLDALVASMNPMKIFDYLAAGIPVVTIQAKGFERFGAAVVPATTAEEFCAALDDFVAYPKDPVVLRALVANENWHARFSAIWSVVEGKVR